VIHLKKELRASGRAVALAKPTLFCQECERLAHLTANDPASRVEAIDYMYDRAVANDLVDLCGVDALQEILAATFGTVPVCVPSKRRAA
jgi:hypothetical protein